MRKYLEVILQICLLRPQMYGVNLPDRETSTVEKKVFQMGSLLSFYRIGAIYAIRFKRGIIRHFYPILR